MKDGGKGSVMRAERRFRNENYVDGDKRKIPNLVKLTRVNRGYIKKKR